MTRQNTQTQNTQAQNTQSPELLKTKIPKVPKYLKSQNGVRAFRPMPFQRLQIQPLQFQPFTLSTARLFDRVPYQPLAILTTAN